MEGARAQLEEERAAAAPRRRHCWVLAPIMFDAAAGSVASSVALGAEDPCVLGPLHWQKWRRRLAFGSGGEKLRRDRSPPGLYDVVGAPSVSTFW